MSSSQLSSSFANEFKWFNLLRTLYSNKKRFDP
jgi:hypothetical protein